MKMYLKVIGVVHVILASLKSSSAAQTDLKTDAAPGTSTGAPQMDQRLLTNTWPETSPAQYIQANKRKH